MHTDRHFPQWKSRSLCKAGLGFRANPAKRALKSTAAIYTTFGNSRNFVQRDIRPSESELDGETVHSGSKAFTAVQARPQH
jgi:hypothetical protein